MNIDDPLILSLRDKVRAAQEEFDQATAYHEAWKPAAFDADVHERMGRSKASGTFNTIRIALRREMVLAMMRLWDTNSSALSLVTIANTLDNTNIVDALALDCEQHWGFAPPSVLTTFNNESDAAVLAMVQESERKHGRAESAKLRKEIAVTIAAIREYAPNGSKHATVSQLKNLRDRHLAHRQIKQPEPVVLKADDPAVEQFYQDMASVVRQLQSVVLGMDYQPDATAEIHRSHAELFWAGVRGERTEGHPSYKLKTAGNTGA